MTDDWQAVARAIEERLNDLGLRQRDLVARSQVSRAVVAEIQHNSAQRRRSDRTLEALSIALDWHPGHLRAVLAGRRPPKRGEPVVRGGDDLPGRLAVIEHQLRELNDTVREVRSSNEDLKSLIGTLIQEISGSRRKPGR